jgi:hypothetical protein
MLIKRLLCRKKSLRIGKVNILRLIINKTRKCILNEIVRETGSHQLNPSTTKPKPKSSTPLVQTTKTCTAGVPLCEVGVGGRWGAAGVGMLAYLSR